MTYRELAEAYSVWEDPLRTVKALFFQNFKGPFIETNHVQITK